MELHTSESRQRTDRDARRHGGGGSGYDQDRIQKATKNSDKEKAKQLSKHFEEQDYYNIVQGQSVVLTLKDHTILADDDINEELDMLQNVEFEEQKCRNEAYKAAKIKTDKFSDDHVSEKRCFEDLNSSRKTSSDYYTQQEMLKFKTTKKTKSIRKKANVLDLDALEAEAVSAGLGAADLGSRNYGRRQGIRDERERSEAETRSNAYQTALAKAYEASKSMQLASKLDEDENPDDEEELFKSLERARKLALQKQHKEETYGPQAIARLAMATANNQDESINGELEENKVVFTETDEFVQGLQLDEEAHKTDSDDVFVDQDEVKVNDTCNAENSVNGSKEDVVRDAITREVAVGKGLSGALELLKKRGSLNEGPEWGGRNMDKKKSKLAGFGDGNNIRIERRDEFGRIMTPKEAFRKDSHKFHGKGPGKRKQEKRQKQYIEESKLKQMNSSSVERMRETQAQLKTPYLVLSTGHL